MKRRVFLAGLGCTFVSRSLAAAVPGTVDFSHLPKLELVPHDHTVVMQFLFQNLSELDSWLTKRPPRAAISQEDALEALKHLKSARATPDRTKEVIDVCTQTYPRLAEKRRGVDRGARSQLASIEQNLKGAQDLKELGALLEKERARVGTRGGPSMEKALEVAQAIYDDAMKHDLYVSVRSVKTSRGKWVPTMKDLSEIAWQDLIGATRGAYLGGPAGGVVGGIASSGQSLISQYYQH